MTTDLAIVEETFQQYLPVLKELYPKDRKDKAAIKKFIEQYQEMMILNNVIAGLFDNPNASIIHLSDNFERITGYKSSSVIKWGRLFPFKAIHPTHYSLLFAAIRNGKKFFNQLSPNESKNTTICTGGLKFVDRQGRTRLAFVKKKILLWTVDGHPDLSIFYGEDVTHLMKSGHYWLRFDNKYKTSTYVNQKGKKQFSELISYSESKILKLMAEKKSTAEIADELFLSKLTVETHRKNMIKRVGAIDSTALVHLCKMVNIL